MNDLRRHWLLAVALAAVAAPGCTTIRSWTNYDNDMKTVGAAPAGTGYTQQVTLTAGNEVPANDSKATGSGSVTVAANHAVAVNITVTGMTATAAHIHMAPAGQEGPVIVPLTKTGDNAFSAPGTATLTDEQYAAFKAGKLYVNVHSAAHPGGEIRAQLRGG